MRAEIVGGDALGRGNEPALCWWLPEESSVQHAYRLRTDDGFDTGHLRTAYDLLRQDTPPSWLTMVDRGATTMWEEWEGVSEHGVPHGSLNHYSRGAVATFLHRYVAGLRSTQPGYRTFEVRPRPGGGITSASTRHVSPFGPIEVSWRLGAGSTELDVLVPPGTTATVVMPGEAPHQVNPGRHHWTGAAPPA